MPDPITPPRSLCIVRLSAIGDTCHVVPIVRTLQRAWPQTRITWVIGRVEARLLGLLPGVEFITVDKRTGLRGLRALRTQLAARHFDVLLHMQLALRASLVASCVRARVKLGFDRPRARELQWLFTDARIAPRTREHVLDSFFGFAAALGIEREALVELIKQSSGRSFGFEVYARLPAPAAFSHGAALLVKDVNLLKRVLPEEQGAETLRAAASNFLAAATGG